jgi:hypothetical protein
MSTLGGDSRGEIAWGVFTDGGAACAVLPHIEACLRTLQIAADVRVGDIPFFYVVDLPYPMTLGTEEILQEQLMARIIQGEYCDDTQRAQLLRENISVRIKSIEQKAHGYIVEIVPTTHRPIGLTANSEQACKSVSLDRASGLLTVEVDEPNEAEVAAHLRLAGNMMGLRWDPRESVNQRFFGKPLL